MMRQLIQELWDGLWHKGESSRVDAAHAQFIRFCMVGVLNTSTTFFIYVILTRTIPSFFEYYLLAEVVAYLCGSIISFILNKRWTFRSETSLSLFEITRFYVALGSGLIVNLGVLYVLVSVLHIYDIVSVALALCVTIAWNFLFMKFWVFKKQA
ncbi:MAG TPA: GtrA family protein [Candidatus Paceibacterota bacterium]